MDPYLKVTLFSHCEFGHDLQPSCIHQLFQRHSVVVDYFQYQFLIPDGELLLLELSNFLLLLPSFFVRQLAASCAFACPYSLTVSLQPRFIFSVAVAAQENRIYAVESIAGVAQDNLIQLSSFYLSAQRLKVRFDSASTMEMLH